MPERYTNLDDEIIEFLLFCLNETLKTPYDEWEAHGGFDDIEDDEYDGSALGADDPDDWLSESDE